MARAIFTVICNKDMQYITKKDTLNRKYDYFTGIRMASDEIHVVKSGNIMIRLLNGNYIQIRKY